MNLPNLIFLITLLRQAGFKSYRETVDQLKAGQPAIFYLQRIDEMNETEDPPSFF